MSNTYSAGIVIFILALMPVCASALTPEEKPATVEKQKPAAEDPVKSQKGGKTTAKNTDATEKALNQDTQNVFSLGLILGDPTGLTLRAGLDEHNAIQANFGYSPFPGSGVVAMADWTYDGWNFLKNNKTAFLWFYFGFGAKLEWFTGRNFYYTHGVINDSTHFGLGMRGLVGIRAPFIKAPFDLFFEFAPLGILMIVPDPAAYYDFDIAMGFRYRF